MDPASRKSSSEVASQAGVLAIRLTCPALKPRGPRGLPFGNHFVRVVVYILSRRAVLSGSLRIYASPATPVVSALVAAVVSYVQGYGPLSGNAPSPEVESEADG